MRRKIKNYGEALRKGWSLSKSPMSMVITLLLNIFATSTIIFGVFGVNSDIGRIFGILALGVLVVVVVFVFLQLPYRGQLSISRDLYGQLAELSGYAELRRQHIESPEQFVWVESSQLVVGPDESGTDLTLRCRLHSTLMDPVTVTKLEGGILFRDRNDARKQKLVNFWMRPGSTRRLIGLSDKPSGGICEVLMDGKDSGIAKDISEAKPCKISLEGAFELTVMGWPSVHIKSVGPQVEVIVDRPLT